MPMKKLKWSTLTLNSGIEHQSHTPERLYCVKENISGRYADTVTWGVAGYVDADYLPCDSVEHGKQLCEQHWQEQYKNYVEENSITLDKAMECANKVFDEYESTFFTMSSDALRDIIFRVCNEK